MAYLKDKNGVERVSHVNCPKSKKKKMSASRVTHLKHGFPSQIHAHKITFSNM